jgi:hypothetical protein
MSIKARSAKIVFKNPEVRQYARGMSSFMQVTDSGAGIAAGRLCEQTGNGIKLNTEQSAAVLGVTRSAITAAALGDVEYGYVPVMMGSPCSKLDRLASRASGYAGKYQAAQVELLAATAGTGFTNQPANDGIEIVSASAADTTQTITLYGTLNGAATTLVTETLTLTGQTQVVSAHTDWGVLLAARLSASCAGTITIREASANATITAGLTTGVLTIGIAAATLTNCFGLIPRHDASDTTVEPVCLVGTGLDGAAINIIDTLNNTTEEDHGTTPFATLVEVYLGGVVATRTVTILSNEASDSGLGIGMALEASTVAGVQVDAYIKPYWM